MKYKIFASIPGKDKPEEFSDVSYTADYIKTEKEGLSVGDSGGSTHFGTFLIPFDYIIKIEPIK